jgi:uncharacterized protein HemX
MHISIGAAILILGVLFLATSKAGLKVLGVVAVVGVVGGGGVLYWGEQQAQQHKAQYAAQKADERAYDAKEYADCVQKFQVPNDPYSTARCELWRH